jgi:hypothetical protein
VSVTERTVETGWRYDTTDGKFLLPWFADCQHVDEEGWDCSWTEVFRTREAAEHAERTHQHFKTYQIRRYNYLSIAEKIWLELDSVIDQIKSFEGRVQGDATLASLRGRAGGLAFGLVQACHPYYADERSVSVEANRRWKMRNGQLDFEQTLGFKYSPPIPGKPQVGVTTHTDPVPVTKRRDELAKLKPADIVAIKQGIGSGMFKAADLAGVYGVSAATIEKAAQT